MRTLLLKSLFARSATIGPPPVSADALTEVGHALEHRVRSLFGRSIAIREVDAGSCNGCELEIHALNNAYYDVERFGIRFVASPRHADVLMVTGPVTKNMRDALERTYHATPDPKWVVAVGDCALDGGMFKDSYAVAGGVDSVVPVDLHIRGCPPNPTALLQGLLALLTAPAHFSARPSRVGSGLVAAWPSSPIVGGPATPMWPPCKIAVMCSSSNPQPWKSTRKPRAGFGTKRYSIWWPTICT